MSGFDRRERGELVTDFVERLELDVVGAGFEAAPQFQHFRRLVGAIDRIFIRPDSPLKLFTRQLARRDTFSADLVLTKDGWNWF